MKEKLIAAYTFVRLWRAGAYTLLILGCLATLGWSLHTLVGGFVAFNSEWDAKKEARATHNQLEDDCEQKIAAAKQEYEAYAKALPERLEAIKQSHSRELKEHTQRYQQEVAEYSQNVQRAVDDYNQKAAIAESELKRNKNYNDGEIRSLSLPTASLHNEKEYLDFCRLVREKDEQIAQYQKRMQDSLLSEFSQYEEPVLNKLREAEIKCESLKRRLSTIEEDYQSRIAELEAQKRDIPTHRYAARPEKNIYGTTSIETLSNVLDSSDALPLIAARLSAADPLSEDSRRNLRKRLLNMSDWLPTYTRTYTATQADINAVHEHNQDLDDRINDLRRELYRETTKLTQEINMEMAIRDKYAQRRDELNEQKKQLQSMSQAASQNWEICNALQHVFEQINVPFPSEFEKSLDARLQQEKNKVPQKEREMQAFAQQLEQKVVRSEEQLDCTLAQLSQQEREACATAIRQPFPCGMICEGIAMVLNAPATLSEEISSMVTSTLQSASTGGNLARQSNENDSKLITMPDISSLEAISGQGLELLKNAENAGKELGSNLTNQINASLMGAITEALPINKWVNSGLNSALSFINPFGAAGAAGAEAVRSIPFGAIILGLLMVCSWLTFSVLLIIGDYMICPLVNATKVQEIAYNTRREETK